MRVAIVLVSVPIVIASLVHSLIARAVRFEPLPHAIVRVDDVFGLGECVGLTRIDEPLRLHGFRGTDPGGFFA